MERQYLIFIAVAAAAFSALIVVGLFFNPLQTEGETDGSKDRNVLEAKVGKEVYVRYSPNVIKMIQNLPQKNSLELEVSSELHNTNLAGLRGEVRYTDMTMEFFQNGEKEIVTDDDFDTIAYRFLPDAGNQTVYTYENVEFRAQSTDSQLIATFVPLSTAEVGQRYTVKLILDAGILNYAIDRVIEIVE